MSLYQRLAITEKLQRRGKVFVSNGRYKPRDIATLRGGFIHVESKFPIVHPLYGYELENPMTWDTFTHLYLLEREYKRNKK